MFYMAIFAKRRENETVEKLINRFKKQTQGCRLIQVIRAKAYNIKKPSKIEQRHAAIKRSSNRAIRRKAELLS